MPRETVNGKPVFDEGSLSLHYFPNHQNFKVFDKVFQLFQELEKFSFRWIWAPLPCKIWAYHNP